MYILYERIKQILILKRSLNYKAQRLFDKEVTLFVSTRNNKKYMIMNDDKKWIHFDGLSRFHKALRRTKTRIIFKKGFENQRELEKRYL